MAIRAVDLAMPVQRTAELNPSQRGDRPEVQQQQFAARLNKEQDEKEQQVQQTPQSEDAQIQKDGRGNSGAYGDSRNKKRKKEQKPTKTVRASDSMFDITV